MLRKAVHSSLFKRLRRFFGLQLDQFREGATAVEAGVREITRNHKKQSKAHQQNRGRPCHHSQVNGPHDTRTSAGTNTYPTPLTLRINVALLTTSSFFLKLLMWTSIARSSGVDSRP